jgi:hypothetical protein
MWSYAPRCYMVSIYLAVICTGLKPIIYSTSARRPASIACNLPVTKKFPGCEHSISLPCREDVRKHICNSVCGKDMSCCSGKCKAKCTDCQLLHPRRKIHASHPCDRVLHCQHLCKVPCSPNHTCICEQPCRQVCSHSRCNAKCSSPCNPCAEQCIWSCAHHSCPMPCGSVSMRYHFLNFSITPRSALHEIAL